MKKLIITALLVILITIKQGEVVSKNQCLIYLVGIHGNKAYFQITLPSMATEKFIMASGSRRVFESSDKEYFFDVIKITESRVSFEITEKK